MFFGHATVTHSDCFFNGPANSVIHTYCTRLSLHDALPISAWPHMMERRYVLIVNTTSSAMTGFCNQTAYATSKGGLWSLTRALAAEGETHGIKVNAISPGAFTRMVSAMLEPDSPLLQYSRDKLPPELASTAVAFLCHERCTEIGRAHV